jgi:hypothetical protein
MQTFEAPDAASHTLPLHLTTRPGYQTGAGCQEYQSKDICA